MNRNVPFSCGGVGGGAEAERSGGRQSLRHLGRGRNNGDIPYLWMTILIFLIMLKSKRENKYRFGR